MTKVWIKKERALFNVTMRAFYGAGVCETVDQPFYQLSKNYNKKDIGLYSDDGRKKQKKF